MLDFYFSFKVQKCKVEVIQKWPVALSITVIKVNCTEYNLKMYPKTKQYNTKLTPALQSIMKLESFLIEKAQHLTCFVFAELV